MEKPYFISFLVLFSLTVSAQRFPDRFYVFNPLFNEEANVNEGKTSLLNSIGGWGEFGAYRILRDNEHAWYQKLGAFVEFFRTRDNESFSVLSNIEFVANPDNDIRFKPRSIFWEEGFVYSRKADSFFWQVGYYHRCKHDIDNYLYGKERALIFGSLQSKVIFPMNFLNEKRNALFSFRTELYTILQDNRYPKNWMDHSYNWKQLIGSLGMNFNFTKPISDQYFYFYLSSYSLLNLFGSEEGFTKRFNDVKRANFDCGFSTGIAVKGKTEIRLGITYEYLSDTGINPYPESTHLVSLGISVIDIKSIK